MEPRLPDDAGVTVFNVFTVRPDNQQALIDSITANGDVSDIPGLLGMRLLRSADGTQVVNHMRWDSAQSMQAAMRDDPRIAATKNRVGQLIEGASPVRYEVAAVLK
ncbi:MAG: antibiotic biosynthesis monooxygenase [Nocardia sp.]|nr:antibiotic biosynthesis monooxygenase [Nocardia sp.]